MLIRIVLFRKSRLYIIFLSWCDTVWIRKLTSKNPPNNLNKIRQTNELIIEQTEELDTSDSNAGLDERDR